MGQSYLTTLLSLCPQMMKVLDLDQGGPVLQILALIQTLSGPFYY